MTTKEIQNAILLLLETHTNFESVSLHTLFLRKRMDFVGSLSLQVDKPQKMFQKSYKIGNGRLTMNFFLLLHHT